MSDTVEVAERVEPAPAGRPSRSLPRRIGEAFLRRREASVLVVAVALGVYFASASEAFLTRPNLVNIAQATAPVAIIAAGMVLVLVNGEIDLSVAAVFAFAPFNMHYLVDYYHVPILLAIVLALAISAFIGFVNGFITVFFRVPSFVTTLGTAYIVIGIVLTTSHAYPAPIPEAATETIYKRLRARQEVESVFVDGGRTPPVSTDIRKAALTISYVPKTKRTHSQRELETIISRDLADIPDVRYWFLDDNGKRNASFIVTGADPGTVANVASELAAQMRRLPSLTDAALGAGRSRPTGLLDQ